MSLPSDIESRLERDFGGLEERRLVKERLTSLQVQKTERVIMNMAVNMSTALFEGEEP